MGWGGWLLPLPPCNTGSGLLSDLTGVLYPQLWRHCINSHSLPEVPSKSRPLLSPGPHSLCVCLYKRHRLNSTGCTRFYRGEVLELLFKNLPQSPAEAQKPRNLSIREVAIALGCPGHSDYLQRVCVWGGGFPTDLHWNTSSLACLWASVVLPRGRPCSDARCSPTFAEDSMELQSSKAWQKMVASLLSRSWILVSKSL